MTTKIDCNFCPDENGAATHDSPTIYAGGAWAYTCDRHFEQYGLPGGTLLKVEQPVLTLVGKADTIYERLDNPAGGSVQDDISNMSIDDMFDYFGDADPSEYL